MHHKIVLKTFTHDSYKCKNKHFCKYTNYFRIFLIDYNLFFN